MFGRSGKRDSAATAAQEAVQPPPGHKRDATEGFPRGLPDGDRTKPSATARWPSAAEMTTLLPTWRPGMFLLGRDEAGRYVGHDDDRHVLTVAGSRAGKGVSLIVPNLLLWPGSVIAIDPKGELATLTASRRSAKGSQWAVPLTPDEGEVYALDPFGRVTGPARAYADAGFNPMADFDLAKPGAFDLASQLADALVIQSHGDGAYWTQAARQLLVVLIYFVGATKPPAEKNLITVRRFLTGGAAGLRTVWAEAAAHPDDYLKVNGKALLDVGLTEMGSIISSAATQTAFLDGPEMKAVLSHSSFRLDEFKRKRVTVYLCLPATRLATHGRWLRLLVSMAMDAMEKTGPIKQGQHRVLFMLDEFAALGTMPTVEKAAGQIASFGVKLWPIIQDLPQLVRDYRDGWETFMGNAGLLTFFGNTDLTTTKHIAERLGETEVVRIVESMSDQMQDQSSQQRPDPMAAFLGGQGGVQNTKGGGKSFGFNKGEQIQRVPLLQPNEVVQVFARERGNILAMIPDKPPCALHRVSYFGVEDEALFGGLFDPIDGQDRPRVTRTVREERDRERR